MKGIVVVFPPLWVSAMVLFPFVIIKNKGDKLNPILINHEKIHLQQQLELLVFPFYLIYFINYVYNLVRYKDHYKAYRTIIFELEAYQNEQNLQYLTQRSFWAWRRLLT